MTRDEFMQEARKTAGRILESKENGIMNLVQQAWAEGKRNAEVETLSGLINEALAKDNNAPRKLAYWVEETNRKCHWHCSNCGRVQGIASVSMKYCPECGYETIEHLWAASGCGQAFCPGKDERERTMLYELETSARQGWICPKCGTVWAPWQPFCSICGDNRTTFATGTTTSPVIDWTPNQTTTIDKNKK